MSQQQCKCNAMRDGGNVWQAWREREEVWWCYSSVSEVQQKDGKELDPLAGWPILNVACTLYTVLYCTVPPVKLLVTVVCTEGPCSGGMGYARYQVPCTDHMRSLLCSTERLWERGMGGLAGDDNLRRCLIWMLSTYRTVLSLGCRLTGQYSLLE
jgi:hypothetical protein